MGIARREALEREVAEIFSNASDGRVPVKETSNIDFKEEAGRRRGNQILPGSSENPEAATKLADEVACFANTPDGGALIVGIDDKTGEVIGTELDVDWLRERINRAVDVAPDIEAHTVEGLRVLVLYIPEAQEPVTNTANALRWRVSDRCVAVDRALWWEERKKRSGADPMAQPTHYREEDIEPATSRLIIRALGDTTLSLKECLNRIGAVNTEGRLTEAASRVFVPAKKVLIEFTELNVPGGNVTASYRPDPENSLLEQLEATLNQIQQANKTITVQEGLRHTQLRQVPISAMREALLNGIIHRDWNRLTPTEVRWITEDATMEVRSPGGFPQGITAENILTQRSARHPALADLFRAMGYVEKQGLGVDRMYQAMIAQGHQPPLIVEGAGSSVECTLYGGEPVAPMIEIVQAIRPASRQQDPRVIIVLDYLLRHSFMSKNDLSRILQEPNESALNQSLRVVAQTMLDGHPLVSPYKDHWKLSAGASDYAAKIQGGKRANELLALPGLTGSETLPYLWYRATDSEVAKRVVKAWLAQTPKITTSDLCELTGITRPTGLRYLNEMVEEGWIQQTGKGRSSAFAGIN